MRSINARGYFWGLHDDVCGIVTASFAGYITALQNKDVPRVRDLVLVVAKVFGENIKYVSVVVPHNIVPR